MNAKLLPEQRLFRFIGKVLLIVFCWPIFLWDVYTKSDRYGQAQFDNFSDAVIFLFSFAVEGAWIVLLAVLLVGAING